MKKFCANKTTPSLLLNAHNRRKLYKIYSIPFITSCRFFSLGFKSFTISQGRTSSRRGISLSASKSLSLVARVSAVPSARPSLGDGPLGNPPGLSGKEDRLMELELELCESVRCFSFDRLTFLVGDFSEPLNSKPTQVKPLVLGTADVIMIYFFDPAPMPLSLPARL